MMGAIHQRLKPRYSITNMMTRHTGTRMLIRLRGANLVLELAAPFPVVAGRQLQPAVPHCGLEHALGVLDHAHLVAVARVHRHVAHEQAALALDFLRAEHALDGDDLRERDMRTAAGWARESSPTPGMSSRNSRR